MSTPGSFYSRLPFSTPKTALRTSFVICVVFAVINSHILFLNGYIDESGNRTNAYYISYISLVYSTNPYHCYTYKDGFLMTPTWDQVQTFLYSLIPALIMIVFNFLLIGKTFIVSAAFKDEKKNTKEKNRMADKQKMTFSLIVITFSFVVLTLPSTIFYGFISLDNYKEYKMIGTILDFFGFLNHTSNLQ